MKISAVLLAGGESRRFGQDKALFPWEGKPLWQHQLNTLRETGASEVLLSARTDPSWRPADVRFIQDAAPACGPIGGLSAALEGVNDSHLLSLAVDMPFMTAAYLRSLMTKILPGRGIVPILNGEPEPLAAVYPREATAMIQSVLAEQTNLALRYLVNELFSAGVMERLPVSPEENFLFQNINRRSDIRPSGERTRLECW